MSYRADKLVIDARMDTHRQTDTGNDNTRRPKLASGKNRPDLLNSQNIHPYLTLMLLFTLKKLIAPQKDTH